MHLTPLTTLTWAYQLHYYLCFRTRCRRTIFSSEASIKLLSELIEQISIREAYHVLEQNSYPTQLRCLLSLRPGQTVAKAIQILKANSSRELARTFGLSAPVWAVGYLARSSGAVRTSAVREYLDSQPTHHGYQSRVLPPVYRFRVSEPAVLKAQHAAFELTHHLVFS